MAIRKQCPDHYAIPRHGWGCQGQQGTEHSRHGYAQAGPHNVGTCKVMQGALTGEVGSLGRSVEDVVEHGVAAIALHVHRWSHLASSL